MTNSLDGAHQDAAAAGTPRRRPDWLMGSWAPIEGLDIPIQVAVMGCVVNGPGEARDADVGIAAAGGQVQHGDRGYGDSHSVLQNGEVGKLAPSAGCFSARYRRGASQDDSRGEAPPRPSRRREAARDGGKPTGVIPTERRRREWRYLFFRECPPPSLGMS